MTARALFSFPHPVNEVSARLVAGGVVFLAVATIASRQPWLVAALAYGFVARSLTGPTLSPLGQLVTRVVTPRLGLTPSYAPGPAKRFAQGVGAAFSVTAAVLALASDADVAANVLVGVLGGFAFLEAAFGLCVGCKVFALLMRAGVIPERVCADCADIWARAAA
jgi:hypothetical protein